MPSTVTTSYSPETASSLPGEAPPLLALQEIVDRCLGNLELADRVITRFRNSLDDTTRQLAQCCVDVDLFRLSQRAHRLKGEASNVGAVRISHQAAKVEEQASTGATGVALLSADLLIQTCREFQRQVFTFSRGEQTSPSRPSRTELCREGSRALQGASDSSSERN